MVYQGTSEGVFEECLRTSEARTLRNGVTTSMSTTMREEHRVDLKRRRSKLEEYNDTVCSSTEEELQNIHILLNI